MIGLLAGAGRFPVIFAEKAREHGHRICCIGFKGLAAEELRERCHQFHSVGIAKMGRTWRTLRQNGVHEVVMAGKIHKHLLLRPRRILELLPDWQTIRFWYLRRRRDNRDDSLLLGVIGEMERQGLHCISALQICPEILVKPGVLTQRAPTRAEAKDLELGWELAKEMGRLDIGQSVAVRDRAVLAVEAIEGTDRAIIRAGELARGGRFVVVKVAKPQQDMRFDVPTVGVSTIESMRAAGGSVLAIEAGKTIFLDEAETVALANRYGIAVVALEMAKAA